MDIDRLFEGWPAGMLFSSNIFLLAFLPLTFAVYYSMAAIGKSTQLAFLTLASFIFYAWWDISFLWVLVVSIVVNYTLHLILANTRSKTILIAGIVANVLFLSYFKYLYFIVGQFEYVSGANLDFDQIVLPIGISFFTFQKIGLLVDTYKGHTKKVSLLNYLLFVTFFPQIIAGPIVHHQDVMPQFERKDANKFSPSLVTVGLAILAIGLAKKVLIADPLGLSANSIFNLASIGQSPSLIEAWYGALSYTLQIYFDFSGYSDMAVGLALLFGIRMPLNFFSPYRSTSIIEFWRRWHMTLSRFLRNYIYIPLGGNRRGTGRRYINLAATMLIGGIWHGAGWTFLVWGGLHGLYLIVNHGWNAFSKRSGLDIPAPFGSALTLVAVVIAWVFFRADGMNTALSVLSGMFGGNGFALPLELKGAVTSFFGTDSSLQFFAPNDRTAFYTGWLYMVVGAAVVLVAPNTAQIFARYRPVLEDVRLFDRESEGGASVRWAGVRLRPVTLIACGLIAATAIHFINSSQVSEFLYFQF